METTKLSSKGQVIIPKAVRASHRWHPGLELFVIEVANGVLLRPKTFFEETQLSDVAGFLKRNRKGALSPDEMNEAVGKGIRRAWRDRP